jgi:hypothetical protein
VPSVTTPEAAPGWYGDPAGARVLRWWNGREWTDDIAARGYEPLPSELLEKERRAAVRAHAALIGVVVAQILAALLWVWFVRRIVDEIDAAIDSDGDDTVVFGSEGFVLQLFGLVSIGLWVLVYLWVYAAATFGRAAGVPARRDPGLAVASFFIPVINFWWPYQSICDTLPPGHPARRRVLRWWLLYLATTFTFVLAAGLAFVPESAGYLVAMGAVAAIAIPMAVVGQAMITDIVAAHEDVLVERRLTASVS